MDQVLIDDDNDSVETVVVGDENSEDERGDSGSCPIIDLEDEQESPIVDKITKNTHMRSEKSFANMLHNNTLMSSIVNKCLATYKSEGMSRIVLRNLKPAFENATDEFKESMEFRVVLKSTLKLLSLDPAHKFSHIKLLCDTLKLRQKKKKVPFVTLPREETDSVSKRSFVDLSFNSPKTRRRKKQLTPETHPTDKSDNAILKSTKSDVIILESETEDDDLIFVNDKSNKQSMEQVLTDSNSNKENERLNVETIDNIGIENDVELIDVMSPPQLVNSNVLLGNQTVVKEQNNLLVPVTVVEIDGLKETDKPNPSNEIKDSKNNLQGNSLDHRLQMLEEDIKYCQSMIEMLEEKEVNDYPTKCSPYIMVDKWKCKAVTLYKEICKLTGEELIKRRTVRLTVQEGHPAGPVRRLESLINSNLDTSGAPMFPDFCDVVNCVKQANLEDGLCWTSMQVMREARSLFTQCGEALRKRRWKREWRYLLGYAKHGLPESDDPADKDPSLMAKLQENKQRAIKKEQEILERFCQIENLPSTASPLMEMRDEAQQASGTSCSRSASPPTNGYCKQSSLISLQNKPALAPIKIEIDNILCDEVPTNIEDYDVPNSRVQNNIEIDNAPQNIEVPPNTDVDLVPCSVIMTRIKVNPMSCSEVTTNIELDDPRCNEMPANIKVDPAPCLQASLKVEVDSTTNTQVSTGIDPTSRIQNMLESLGSNFETTVFDIEDPYLVIEISDSSSSDSE